MLRQARVVHPGAAFNFALVEGAVLARIMRLELGIASVPERVAGRLALEIGNLRPQLLHLLCERQDQPVAHAVAPFRAVPDGPQPAALILDDRVFAVVNCDLHGRALPQEEAGKVRQCFGFTRLSEGCREPIFVSHPLKSLSSCGTATPANSQAIDTSAPEAFLGSRVDQYTFEAVII
jgi:hypothetical protein